METNGDAQLKIWAQEIEGDGDMAEGVAQQEWQSKTQNGYEFSMVTSAMQKSIRRGCEKESVYWALELAESGFDLYVWKRLSIIAVEDIGLANPGAIVVLNSLRESWMAFRKVEKGKVRLPETNLLTLGVLYLCRQKRKNREADDLAWMMDCERKRAVHSNRRMGKTEVANAASEGVC